MSNKSDTKLTLMPGTSRGAPRSGRQLEIFPLHTGSNPARPEGGPRPVAEQRSTTVRPALQLTEGTEQATAHWEVASEEWAKVERSRGQRTRLARSNNQPVDQGPAEVTQLEEEVDTDRMTTVEKVLASIGVPIGLLLLITII